MIKKNNYITLLNTIGLMLLLVTFILTDNIVPKILLGICILGLFLTIVLRLKK